MPVHYTIDAAANLVRTRVEGALTTTEIRQHLAVLGADPNLPSPCDVLLDARGASLPFSVDMLRTMVAALDALRGRVRFRSMAGVAGGLAQYGVLRMGEPMLEKYFARTRAFRDVEEAERWLSSVREPVA